MRTRLLKSSAENIAEAAALIRAGQVVAFPTETVYGLGANALDADAVARVFAAKGRPADNPLIVHVASAEDAAPLCHWTQDAQALAQAFWPGPLTMLLRKRGIVPEITTAGLQTVAVRVPRHALALALINASGCPIAAPSANRSGRPSPTSAAHVLEDMSGRIPLILDGGSSAVGVESTVLDMSGGMPTILRPGAVTCEHIAMVLGKCRVADSVMRPVLPGEDAPSPGMRHKHYAPMAKMTLVKGEAGNVAKYITTRYDKHAHAAILAFEDHVPLYGGRRTESLGSNAMDAAHRLFYLLRDMDLKGVTRIYAETLPEDGLGLAVMNRMSRAAGFDLVNADNDLEGEHE